MSTHEQTCYTCWSTFTTSHPFVTTCPTCQQTKALNNANDRRAQEEQDRQAALIRQQEYAAEQNARIIAAAEYDRAAAIREQTKVIIESSITDKQAYNLGYNYIDDDFPFQNSLGLEIIILPDGGFYFNYAPPYYTKRLNNKFFEGLATKASEYSSPTSRRQTLLDSAYQAGKGNAEGTLNSYFTLYTDVNFNGMELDTEGFRSNFKSYIDEDTGELKMEWTDPFGDDEELNQRYQDGVYDVYDERNTDEEKQYRLEHIIPGLKRDRRIVSQYKILSKVSSWSLLLFMLYICTVIWKFTHGWTLLLCAFGLMIFYRIVDAGFDYWQEHMELQYGVPKK